MKKAERENEIAHREQKRSGPTSLHLYICASDVTTEQKMKRGGREELSSLSPRL